MLFYNRESNFEGIDVNRNSEPISTEYSFCHFYFLKDRSFNCQPYFYNECHDLSMHSPILVNMKTITIIKNNTYRFARNISYNESIYLMESSDLTGKTGSLSFFNVILS